MDTKAALPSLTSGSYCPGLFTQTKLLKLSLNCFKRLDVNAAWWRVLLHHGKCRSQCLGSLHLCCSDPDCSGLNVSLLAAGRENEWNAPLTVSLTEALISRLQTSHSEPDPGLCVCVHRPVYMRISGQKLDLYFTWLVDFCIKYRVY